MSVPKMKGPVTADFPDPFVLQKAIHLLHLNGKRHVNSCTGFQGFLVVGGGVGLPFILVHVPVFFPVTPLTSQSEFTRK